jgi:hypothetical protein
MENAYAVAVGQDLLHWHVVSDAEFPPNARHGSILAVTEDELSALREHLNPEGAADLRSEGAADRPMV